MAQVDEKKIVFLIATHRMAHNIGASFLLGDILEKLNYLKRISPDSGSLNKGIFTRMASFAKEELKKLPPQIQEALKPLLYPLYRLAKSSTIGDDFPQISSRMDLKNCICFPHENGNLISGIRINLMGREPSGIVKPGKELEDLCQKMSIDLLSLVEKDSGKPIVKRVLVRGWTSADQRSRLRSGSMDPKFPRAVTLPQIRKSSAISAQALGEANGIRGYARIVMTRCRARRSG